jgi:hypothetical protein
MKTRKVIQFKSDATARPTKFHCFTEIFISFVICVYIKYYVLSSDKRLVDLLHYKENNEFYMTILFLFYITKSTFKPAGKRKSFGYSERDGFQF